MTDPNCLENHILGPLEIEGKQRGDIRMA